MSPGADRLSIIQALFSCSEEIAPLIAAQARWQQFARHHVLIHQGDFHDKCHLVVDGSVGISVIDRDGTFLQIATVEPGEIFGAYPEACQVNLEVYAQQPLELLSFNTAYLARIALDHSQIGAGLARIFARQLNNTLSGYASHVTLSATGRVYQLLLSSIDSTGVVTNPPKVAALAVRAQTTRETASRALSVLERRGILQREASFWKVTAPRLLENLIC
jgi:CRP/FNR family transcriptional regulator, cyclic AMP receptor protein